MTLKASVLSEIDLLTGESLSLGGSSRWMMSVQPAAEAKKAEGASWVPLLTPSPPDHTGSDA